MILNVEADELCYRAAFACEKTGYIVHTSKSKKDCGTKYTKTSLVKFFEERGKLLDRDYTLETYKAIDQEIEAKHTIDQMVMRLYNLQHGDLGKVEQVNLFLSPSDHSNFRYKVASTPGPKGFGYKAGRGERPHYYKLIRNRLKTKWKAEEVLGNEADDALGIYANDNSVAVHMDKDINMIPGWHYNHVNMSWSYVDKEGVGKLEIVEGKVRFNGLIGFYLQLLTGDSIDNVPGCLNPKKTHHKVPPKLSDKEAYKLLEGVNDEIELFHIIKGNYEYTYGNKHIGVLKECADLLWIKRKDLMTGSQYLKHRGFI